MTISSAPALQLTSEGKTFWRVEQELRWSEALDYCRQHHTDLADLQSMNSWSSIKALYSLTSSTGAWIGLFFDVQTRGPRWSSGSIFSIPVWTSMPSLEEGLCVTLYSITLLVSLGAASCTAQKPFICYYGVFSHLLGLVFVPGSGGLAQIFLRITHRLASQLFFAPFLSAAFMSISSVPLFPRLQRKKG